jgi:protein-tyrosine-phosphatase
MMADPLRAVSRAVRRAGGRAAAGAGSLADRLLHATRRRRALQRVDELARLSHVLFICHGNIWRSPYAERRFAAAVASLADRAPRTSSAGFIGPDRPPPDEAIAAAAEKGIDMREHRSRLALASDLALSDLIVVMEPKQGRRIAALSATRAPILVLGDLDPTPTERRAIRDPWSQPATAGDVYARIDRCIAALGTRVRERASRPLERGERSDA